MTVRAKSLERSVKVSKAVQGQNGQQRKDLCGVEKIVVCISLSCYTQKPKSSRHRVHLLASVSDGISLGKVQG